LYVFYRSWYCRNDNKAKLFGVILWLHMLPGTIKLGKVLVVASEGSGKVYYLPPDAPALCVSYARWSLSLRGAYRLNNLENGRAADHKDEQRQEPGTHRILTLFRFLRKREVQISLVTSCMVNILYIALRDYWKSSMGWQHLIRISRSADNTLIHTPASAHIQTCIHMTNNKINDGVALFAIWLSSNSNRNFTAISTFPNQNSFN